MRTSFAASIFAIAPLLASQAVAAPTANFLGNFFDGIGDKPPVETKIAQTDVPWHFLNIYIFPKRAEDDNAQLRFRFSDDNPNHKISVTCSKEASSEEELFMEKYEPCGDSDVSFRYRGDTIQVWRKFDETIVSADGTGRAQAYGETEINLRPLGDGTLYQNEAFISSVQDTASAGLKN